MRTLLALTLLLAGCATGGQLLTTEGRPVPADVYATAKTRCHQEVGLDMTALARRTAYTNAELAKVFRDFALVVECMDRQHLAVAPARVP